MTKLPEPACTVSPYEVNHIFWEAGHEQAGCGSSLFTESQMLQFRRDALEEAQAWLPIESAPKDGTEVITGHPDGSIDVLRWLEVKTNRRGWTDGEYFALSWPTHWMPLPVPPK